jgi:hypothetical protein
MPEKIILPSNGRNDFMTTLSGTMTNMYGYRITLKTIPPIGKRINFINDF